MSTPTRMASLGHADPHAPQAIQSTVILRAIACLPGWMYAKRTNLTQRSLVVCTDPVNDPRPMLPRCLRPADFSLRFRSMRKLAVGFGVCCLALVALGCAPKIGDDCTSSTDCSINGDRLCDTTQPGGYCTVFNCEPDTCPEEAQCVAFDMQIDPACYDPQHWGRFERTFCMLRCDNNGDCRSGYLCSDMAQQPNPWGAAVVDGSPTGTKVCVSAAISEIPQPQSTAICRPYEGDFGETQTGEPSPNDAVADAGSESDDAGE